MLLPITQTVIWLCLITGNLLSFHLQESNTMLNLAVALENEGISSFRFDFSGNG